MLDWIEAHWMLAAALAVAVLLVAVLVFARRSRPAAPRAYTDVLSEGAATARRNAALIDAPSAAARVATPITPPPAAGVMAGVAEIVAHAAEAEVESAATQSAAPAAADDLTRIKGIGPKLNALLTSLGITRYAQIAAWGEDDLARIDAQLGSFAGRPRRDNWVEQARLLAGGDQAAYEAQFGRL